MCLYPRQNLGGTLVQCRTSNMLKDNPSLIERGCCLLKCHKWGYNRIMEELPTQEESKEIVMAYEPDYEIDDKVFFEPFQVLKLVSRESFAWWNGIEGRGKVERLISAFKNDLNIFEACISAGISRDQYMYFCKIHPRFLTVKQRCKGVLSILAKQGLAGDIVHKEGFRTRQWYLEKRQSSIYGRDIGVNTPPPAEAATKVTGEAFLDKDGKLIISKQTAEALQHTDGED